jgi:hypothetical protein
MSEIPYASEDQIAIFGVSADVLGGVSWGQNGEATIGLGFPRDNSYVPYVHGGFSSTQ